MKPLYIFAIILLLLTSLVFSQTEATPKKTEKATYDYVGVKKCKICHKNAMEEIFEDFNGNPGSSIHSRFMNEGTDNMVYPELWPKPWPRPTRWPER